MSLISDIMGRSTLFAAQTESIMLLLLTAHQTWIWSLVPWMISLTTGWYKAVRCGKFFPRSIWSNPMTEKMIAAIEAALAQGHRVQLKRLKDGTIKMQIVYQKELKVE